LWLYNIFRLNPSDWLYRVTCVRSFYGVCVHGARLHCVTEFIHGGSLEDLLAAHHHDVSPAGRAGHAAASQEEDPLPFDTRIRLARQVAEAMDYVHCRGYFHRDLASKVDVCCHS
jgi:serine/threonine protein kinase